MAAVPDLTKALGNNISTTLSSGINASDTSISVTSGAGMNPTGGFAIIDEGTLSEEVVYVESVSGNNLTIATGGRGLSGTTGVSHSSGATLTDILVKEQINDLVDEVSGIAADITAVIGTIYPVGTIYTSVVSTNPNTLFGIGTWVAFGTGRVMVGIDAGQTEFDTVEETGGAKTHTLQVSEMPSHTHTQNSHTHSIFPGTSTQHADDSGFGTFMQPPTQAGGTTGSTTATNQNTGGGGSHNNLQPYIVVYMWKRTA